MMRLFVRIVEPLFVAREIIVKEICGYIYADHVSDIEIAHHGQRKQDHKPLVFEILDKLFDRQCKEGKPHHGVYPH